MIRQRRGLLLDVTDEEMLEAQRELAGREGLFGQPESATTLAALKKLAAKPGGMDRDGDSVLVLTGSGLKTPNLPETLPVEILRLALDDLAGGLARLAG